MLRNAPFFLITIDTEGDNLWARPQKIEAENAKYLPRFQELCEKFGFKPTYLTNYEMAIDPYFVDFGRATIAKNTAEIGMHLHAWNSPPINPLTTNDNQHCPFLVEYPIKVMHDKIRYMTELLEDTFAVKMKSHRAGRWAFNEAYAKALVTHGYTIDCSVTPGISWAGHSGTPKGWGGTDYIGFPSHPYYVDLDDISRPGQSQLLEVPMTIQCPLPRLRGLSRSPAGSLRYRLGRKLAPASWLRPDGKNIASMLALVKAAAKPETQYIEFMLHSSEFMPGGSPVFPDKKSIETLFDHMETLFSYVSGHYQGCTLSEFGENFSAKYQEPNTTCR